MSLTLYLQWPPSYTDAEDCSSPAAALHTSPCWTSLHSCWPISPAANVPLDGSTTLGCFSHSSHFESSAQLLLVHCPSSWSLMKMLNRTEHSLNSQHSPVVTGFQLGAMLLKITLWTWPFTRFMVHLCSSSLYINSFSMRNLWDTTSKPHWSPGRQHFPHLSGHSSHCRTLASWSSPSLVEPFPWWSHAGYSWLFSCP